MVNNDLGLSPMALARRSGQASAVAQCLRAYASALMQDATRVHESTVDEKLESILTTKEKEDETMNNEQLMQIIQQQHADNIAQQNAIAAQKDDIASLKAMLERALSSVGTPNVTEAKPAPTIPYTDNINYAIVGQTLFMAVSLDRDKVIVEQNASKQDVYCQLRTRKNCEGHSLVANGLNITMTVLDMANNAQGNRKPTPG